MSGESRLQRQIEQEKQRRKTVLASAAKKAGVIALPIVIGAGAFAFSNRSNDTDSKPKQAEPAVVANNGFFSSPQFLGSLDTSINGPNGQVFSELKARKASIKETRQVKLGNTTLHFATLGLVRTGAANNAVYYGKAFDYSRRLASENPQVSLHVYGIGQAPDTLNPADTRIKTAQLTPRNKDVAVIEVDQTYKGAAIDKSSITSDDTFALTASEGAVAISLMRSIDKGQPIIDSAVVEGCQAAIDVSGDDITNMGQEMICNALGRAFGAAYTNVPVDAYLVETIPRRDISHSYLATLTSDFAAPVPALNSEAYKAILADQPFSLEQGICYPMFEEPCK